MDFLFKKARRVCPIVIMLSLLPAAALGEKKECEGLMNRWTNCIGIFRWDDASYEGEWVNGEPHGGGKFTYRSGSIYEGQVKNRLPSGKGTLTYPSGTKYVGEYREGKFSGKGTMTWTNGMKYVGEYREGKRNGKGTFTHSKPNKRNEIKYIGNFKDNKWFGVGIMYFADGSKYYGEHERGRTGQGILVSADGKVKVGIWNRNNYEGPLPEGVAQKFTIESLKDAEKTAEAKRKPLVKPKLKTQETEKNTDTSKPKKPETRPAADKKGTGKNDIKSRLRNLKELEVEGLISKEEAARKRKELLDKL